MRNRSLALIAAGAVALSSFTAVPAFAQDAPVPAPTGDAATSEAGDTAGDTPTAAESGEAGTTDTPKAPESEAGEAGDAQAATVDLGFTGTTATVAGNDTITVAGTLTPAAGAATDKGILLPLTGTLTLTKADDQKTADVDESKDTEVKVENPTIYIEGTEGEIVDKDGNQLATFTLTEAPKITKSGDAVELKNVELVAGFDAKVLDKLGVAAGDKLGTITVAGTASPKTDQTPEYKDPANLSAQLGTGGIAGIVVGVIALLALIGGLGYAVQAGLIALPF